MEKNIKKFSLLSISLLLLIPNIVKASLTCYQLRLVTNPNGIDVYCDNDTCEVKHLKENEVFYVISDPYEDDIENCKNCQINTIEGEYYTIKNLEGTRTPQEDDFNETFFNKYYSKRDNAEGIIYNENGVDIRKGPDKSYDIIGHIENDEKITYTYIANDSNCKSYAYVNYNNIKGWIKYDENVLTKEKHKYITTKDINIGCATIPKNTIIDTSYTMHVIDENYGILVEYNNCKKAILDINDSINHEFLNVDTINTENNDILIAKEDITIYEYYNNEGKVLITIPKGKEYIRYTSHWITDSNSIVTDTIEYVSYNGIKGWIKKTEKSNIEKNNPQTTEKVNQSNYITIYIIICSVIVLTALVIITLINQKKEKVNI